MRCPNKNHPEWKALVKELGEDDALLAYMLNGDDIPSIEKANSLITDHNYRNLSPEEQAYLQEQNSWTPEKIATYEADIAAGRITPPEFSLPDEGLSQEDLDKLQEGLLLPGFKSFTVQQEGVNIMTSAVLSLMQQDKATFEAAYEIVSGQIVELVADGKEVFAPIASNKQGIKELIKTKLIGINLMKPVKTKLSKEIDSEEENGAVDNTLTANDATDLDKNHWQDDWVLTYDSKKSALEAIKTVMAFIPVTEFDEKLNDYVEVASEFRYVDKETNELVSYPMYMMYDEVFDTVKAITAGSINTWSEMKKALEAATKAKPFIYNLLYQIENYDGDKKRLQNQFVSVMRSYHAKAKTVLHDEEKGIYEGKVVDSDQNTLVKQIKSTWTSSFKRSGLISFDKSGNEVVDTNKAKSLIDRIRSTKKLTINDATKILSELGIEISEGTQQALALRLEQEVSSKYGLFNMIAKRLEGYDAGEADEEDKLSEFNPILGNKGIDRLSRDEAKFGAYVFTNTYINGQGNSVQSYIFNNALTLEFDRIQNDENYLESLLNLSFNKVITTVKGKPIYKTLLYELQNNQAVREIFNIAPLDVIRKQETGRQGLKLTEMSPLDLEATTVWLFQNSGATKKGVTSGKGRVMNYLLTVPSKTMAYTVTLPAIDVTVRKGVLDNSVQDALYSIAASEMNRIYSVQDNKNISNSAYKEGGKKFYFFPSLNDLPIFDNNGKLMLPTTTVEGRTVESIVREGVNKAIALEFENTRKNWKELGIIKEEQEEGKEKRDVLSIVDKRYASTVLKTNNEEDKITLAIADYVVNTHLAKFNMHQTAIGDPALFYKKGDIKAWEENIHKRLAGVIAPRKELALDDLSETLLYLNLEDRERDNRALNYAQLIKRLQDAALPYQEINGTDAQEYVTLKEELAVRYKLGNLPTEVYEDILTRYEKDPEGLILSKEELGFVFGASKPVYYYTRIDSNDDVAYKDYIKSASIPLLPQFTKGLEIDKLRKLMEKVERDNPGKTVRAAHKSSIKVGGKKMLNIYGEAGTIKDDLVVSSDNLIEVRRAGFGIQQEVPYKEGEGEIPKSTQVTKLLFDGIVEYDGFRFQGEIYNGINLKDQYLNLTEQLYSESLKELRNEILIEEEGKDPVINTKALQAILLEEGKKRGYTEAELRALGLTTTETEFKLPLWANPTAKFESLLTSLFSNNVVKQSMRGRSYVLVSEEGMKGRSADIVYTGRYDEKTGLKPMRIVYKKEGKAIEEAEYQALSEKEKEGYVEETAGAQILIPWTYRTTKGKTINIKNYIKDGKINLSKLSPSLLKQFGFRIPNQGHNSMSYLEVVGFLPEVMGDVVIAPRNLVTQMGSDFDVDKLYVYQYNIFRKKGGKLRKFTLGTPKEGKTIDSAKKFKAIQNKLLELHLSVLSNPAVFNQTVRPLSTGKLKYSDEQGKSRGVAVEVKSFYERQRPSSLLSVSRDNAKYLQSVDGKSMVGITSLISTFSSILYQTGEDIYPYYTIQTSTGEEINVPVTFVIGRENQKGEIKPVELSSISSAYTTSKQRKLYAISAFQSAAVDNEKDPIIYYINAVPETSDVLAYLLHLGLDEDYVAAFLGQPIIKEFVESKRLRGGSVKISGEEYKTDDQILDGLVVKYATKVETELGKEQGTLLENDEFLKQLDRYPLSLKQLMSVFRETTKSNLPVVIKTGKESEVTYTLTPDQIQLIVLQKFAEARKYGEYLSRAQSTLNLDSKGVGASLIEVADKTARIKKLFRKPPFMNFENVLAMDKAPLGFSIEYGLFPANATLNSTSLYPYGNPRVMEAFKTFEEGLNREATLEQKEDFWEGLKAYILTSKLLYKTEDVTKLREELFFDRNENKSLATLVEELKLEKAYKYNPFLIRLTTDIDKTGKKPSRVYYSATKQEVVDGNNTYQAFLQLLVDPKTRPIADKLVKYFYINGGTQQAREWGKLIDPGYLEVIGITEALRKYSFNDQSLQEDAVTQYFQHTPHLLPSLSRDKKVRSVIGYKGSAIETASELFLPTSTSKNAILGLINKTSEIGGYVNMFVIRNNKERKGYSIFKFLETRTQEDGSRYDVYKRLPVLGDKFYNEYQYEGGVGESLITKNKVTVKEKVKHTPKNTPIADTKTIENTTKIYTPSTVYDKTTAKDVLTVLEENAVNSNHKALAKFFKQLLPLIGDVAVNINTNLSTSGGEPVKGRFQPQTGIELNPSVFKDNKNKSEWEALFLHELIHAAYGSVILDGKANAIQLAANTKLINIFKALRGRVLSGELESAGLYAEELTTFDKLLTKTRGGQKLTAEESLQMRQLKRKYYPLSVYDTADARLANFQEFLTHILTDEVFQEVLNSIPYDGKKTFIDRVLELIAEVLANFSVVVNSKKQLELNQESVLAESLKQSLFLFSSAGKKTTTETKPESRKSLFDFNKKEAPPKGFDDQQQSKITEQFDLAADAIDEESELRYRGIINSLRTRIYVLNQAIQLAYTDKDFVKAKELEARRDSIAEEIEKLIEDNTLATVIEQGKNDLKRAEAILDQDYLSANDINYVKSVAAIWLKAPELVLDQTEIKTKTANYKKVAELRNIAASLEERVSIVAKESLLQMVRKTAGIDTIKEETLTSLEKTNIVAASLLDLSRNDNVIAKVLDKWMRESAYQTNLEVQNLIKQQDDLVKALRETETFKKDGYYVFAQRDEKGELTGNLVSSLKTEYYKERDRLLNFAREEKNPKKRAKKFERYFKWVKENHIIVDVRELFKQDNNGLYTFNPNVKYLEELKTTLGEDFDKVLQLNKERIEYYNEQLQAKIDSVAGDPDGFRSVEEWKLANDPSIYIQNLLEGYVERKANGKTVFNKGHKYTVKRATDTWVDDNYKKIKGDKALNDYYEFITSTLKQLYGYLPIQFTGDLTNFTIPNVSKSIAERYNEEGVRAAIAGLKENWLQAITVNNSASSKDMQDPVTKKIINTLSVLYTERIDPEDKSYDLARVVQIFALQAVAFKHNAKIEDQVKLADSVFKDALELQRRPDGYPKLDRFGEKLQLDTIESLQKAWDYRIEAYYGKRKKDQATTSYTVPKEGMEEEAEYLTKYIDALNAEQPFDEVAPITIKNDIVVINRIKNTKDRLKALEDLKSNYVRYYSGSKMVDQLLQYVQIKGMGWNPFSATINAIIGIFSNATWAAGGVDFGMNEYWRAMGIMTRAVSGETADKVNSLLLRFDVLKEINEAAYESTTNSNALKKGVKRLAPLEMQRMSERFVQGQTMVAMMLHQKVKTLTGEEISLWEAFDSKGNWRTDILGENADWSTDLNKLNVNGQGFKFKFKLDQIIKSIHGNYDPNSPVLIKKGIAGRAVMQFRSWIAEGFEQRIGSEKFDLLLERKRKGRYRTLADLGFAGSAKTALKLIFQGDKAFEGLRDSKGKLIKGTDLDIVRENMRKNLAEATQLLMLYTISLILQGIDTDDEDERLVNNYALNTALRLIDDSMFFYNPNAFENITRSAVPAATLIGDIYDTLDAAGQAIVGEDIIPTGVKAGESRLAWRAARLFPFTSAVSAVANKFRTEESFRK